MDMLIEMPKGKKILFTIAAFLTSIAVMGEMGILPFVYNLYETFDNYFMVNYIISAGAIFMVVGSVLATVLMGKFSKKSLLIIAGILFAVSSIFCVAVYNTVYICLMRTIMGIGEGMTNVVIMAYIAQLYVAESKRAAFIGYYNAAMMVIGAVMSYAGGVLAYPEWTNAFNLYWPSVLMVIGIVLFIPNLKDFEVQKHQEKRKGDKKEPLGSLFAAFIVAYIFYTWMYANFAYYISSYVAEMKLGTSVFAGTLTSLSTIAGLILAILFGKIYGVLQKHTTIPCIILTMIALALLCLFPNTVTAIIGSMLIGIAYGMYYAYSYTYVASIVHYTRIDDAIGITTTLYGLAYALFAYINSGLIRIFNTKGQYTPTFLVWAFVGIIPLVIELITIKPYNAYIAKEDAQYDEGSNP
jgi:MFS family permease